MPGEASQLSMVERERRAGVRLFLSRFGDRPRRPTIKGALLIMLILGAVSCRAMDKTALATPGTDKASDLVASPDGRKTLNTMTTSDGGQQIFLADANGHHAVQITFDGMRNHSPVWSPCGRHILFISDRDGDAEVFLMDADGDHQRQLTFNEHWDGNPAWSPDGREIFFSCKPDGDVERYAISDGAGTIKLGDDWEED